MNTEPLKSDEVVKQQILNLLSSNYFFDNGGFPHIRPTDEKRLEIQDQIEDICFNSRFGLGGSVDKIVKEFLIKNRVNQFDLSDYIDYILYKK